MSLKKYEVWADIYGGTDCEEDSDGRYYKVEEADEYFVSKQEVRECLMEWFYNGEELTTPGQFIWKELKL